MYEIQRDVPTCDENGNFAPMQCNRYRSQIEFETYKKILENSRKFQKSFSIFQNSNSLLCVGVSQDMVKRLRDREEIKLEFILIQAYRNRALIQNSQFISGGGIRLFYTRKRQFEAKVKIFCSFK